MPLLFPRMADSSCLLSDRLGDSPNLKSTPRHPLRRLSNALEQMWPSGTQEVPVNWVSSRRTWFLGNAELSGVWLHPPLFHHQDREAKEGASRRATLCSVPKSRIASSAPRLVRNEPSAKSCACFHTIFAIRFVGVRLAALASDKVSRLLISSYRLRTLSHKAFGEE